MKKKFVLVKLVIVLSILCGVMLSCGSTGTGNNADPEVSNAIPEVSNADPEVSNAIPEVSIDKLYKDSEAKDPNELFGDDLDNAKNVLIYVPGGPSFRPGNFSSQLDVETDEFVNLLRDTLKQSERGWYVADLIQYQAVEENEVRSGRIKPNVINNENMRRLERVIKFFNTKSKNVYVMGFSYGAFLVQEYITEKGLDGVSRFYIVGSRLTMPKDIADHFRDSFPDDIRVGSFYFQNITVDTTPLGAPINGENPFGLPDSCTVPDPLPDEVQTTPEDTPTPEQPSYMCLQDSHPTHPSWFLGVSLSQQAFLDNTKDESTEDESKQSPIQQSNVIMLRSAMNGDLAKDYKTSWDNIYTTGDSLSKVTYIYASRDQSVGVLSEESKAFLEERGARVHEYNSWAEVSRDGDYATYAFSDIPYSSSSYDPLSDSLKAMVSDPSLDKEKRKGLREDIEDFARPTHDNLFFSFMAAFLADHRSASNEEYSEGYIRALADVQSKIRKEIIDK